MKEILIIGYGNTLRGDDGLGPYIVESLRDIVGNLGINVRIISLPQLDVILALDIHQAGLVIFVDARTDDIDELVSIKQVKPVEENITLNYTAHTIDIPVLLRISLDWYGPIPVCYAVMPKGYDFSLSEIISEKAQISAERARNKVVEIIQSIVLEDSSYKM